MSRSITRDLYFIFLRQLWRGVRGKNMKRKTAEFEEVSSIEWKDRDMSDQEEDLVFRIHQLVGDRWDLIAGRIPGRTDEEVERFWIMKHRQIILHFRPKKKRRFELCPTTQ